MVVKRTRRAKPVVKIRHEGNIEIVSFAEIYRTGVRPGSKSKRQVRLKRVCGKYLGSTKGYCTATAGKGTSHFGVGYCYRHPGTPDQENHFRIEYLKFRSSVSLEDYMAGMEISDDDMGSLKAEVALLSGMLKHIVRDNPDDRAITIALIEKISRLKKTYAEIQTMRLSVSPKQIAIFVEDLLSIVKAIAGDTAVLAIQERFQNVMLTFGKGATLQAMESDDGKAT